jgi:hypothetical protein
MAHTKKVSKAKLIIGVMYKDKNVYEKAIDILKTLFGEIESSLEFDFSFTKYYEKEMGTNLKKTILVFKKNIDRIKLPDIKLITNGIEDDLSNKNNRTVNIDPGYMTFDSIVLASAKEMPHRVYLKKGIFADVVLTFYDGNFEHNIRTFPDYRQDIVKDFFKKIRTGLLAK